MTDDIPQAHKTQVKGAATRKGGLRAASLVWLVPFAALLVALGMGYTAYSDRGPLIKIAFEDAGGILPKETEVRFRNVPVGIVEKVAFNSDLSTVLVEVQLDKDVAPFVDDGAEFWVVQPEVTTSGVSGLQTVLSGVYIAGNWDNTPGGSVTSFEGLAEAPLATAYTMGTQITLRSTRTSGLSENVPIVYKGIEVGRVGQARITPDGDAVVANAIIYDPHTRLVSSATRFWDTSGFSFSIGANGAELDFSSLASLISGGLTFDTLVSGGTALEEGMQFDVYSDQNAARAAVFQENDGETVTLRMIFEDNVGGLTAGAPVEWRGLEIGEVVSVSGIVDQERFGDARVRLLVTTDIRPSRFGLGRSTTSDEALDYLAERVDDGLRARLTNASILTGGLKIEFVVDDQPEGDILERDAEPFPIMPVTASEIADAGATAEGVLSRVNALPFEELLDSTIAFLDNATALVANQSLQDTPAEILGLVTDARGVVSSEAVQTLPDDIATLVTDLQSASGDLSALLSDLREAGAVERLLAAVDQAGSAAEAVTTGLAGVPDLTDRITTLADTANALPLEELLAEANGLAAEARVLIASEALKALPGEVTDAVGQLDTLLTSLNEADTAQSLNAALTEAANAANAVETAVAGLPDLTSRITTFVDGANQLPLDELTAQAAGFASEARTLIASEALQALPTSVAGAVAELETLLTGLTQANTAETLNTALVNAADAADAVELSVAGIPALITRLDAIAAQAEKVRLDELAAELDQVLATASALLGETSEADLPQALAGALFEAEAALAELRAGGLVASANQTLASASDAARAIAAAANDLPALAARLGATLGQAQTTLADFDGSSAFNRQTTQTLREIERAAKAVSDLARTINRRPNSLIIGR